jgi:hypothetical protein
MLNSKFLGGKLYKVQLSYFTTSLPWEASITEPLNSDDNKVSDVPNKIRLEKIPTLGKEWKHISHKNSLNINSKAFYLSSGYFFEIPTNSFYLFSY